MIQAIVYTSNTGYTARYAKLLAEQTGLPVFSLGNAIRSLPSGAEVIYFGWLMASMVKGYGKAAKRFQVKAVVGVGMADSGTLTEPVRKANQIPERLPVFTLQGGYDRSRLRGMYGLMMDLLVKKMRKDQEKNPNFTQENRQMLERMRHGGDWVSQENLEPVVHWCRSSQR